MKNNMCTLFSFLNAAKGNWRNSIYIECYKCQYGKSNPCSGFLLVHGCDGQPVVILENFVQGMTGLGADKNECLAVLYRQDFEALYALWLEWNVSSSNECALMQIVKQNSCGCADKGCQCCFQKNI